MPYFGFGEDPKLVKDSVLAIMLLSGLFGAVLSASASVAHEIRSGTALAVLAKPVGRAQFILAKYFGLVGALAVLTFVNLLSSLLASRMAFDAYGNTDTMAFWIFSAFVAMAYALGGFTNYFLRRPFVADAVFFVVAMITVAFVAINFIDKEGKWQTFAAGVDWRLIQRPSNLVRPLHSRRPGSGLLHSLGNDPDSGGLFRFVPPRLDVRLPVWAARGGGFLVGLSPLHPGAELAAFLAR